MIFFLFAQVFAVMLDLPATRRLPDHQKDVQILLLRQQLRILQRKHPKPLCVSCWEKSVLAILAVRFRVLSIGTSKRLDEAILLFKPETVLKWHRELVRGKWTFSKKRAAGRPATNPELQALLPRLARENQRWGYSKLHGELTKLGYRTGRAPRPPG